MAPTPRGNVAHVASEDAAIGQLFETPICGYSRLKRRRREACDSLGDPLERSSGLQRLEKNRLGRLEPGFIRLEFGRG